MNHAKGTLTLVILAVALFAYIVLFEGPRPSSAGREGQAPRLLADLDPAKVTAVAVAGTNVAVRAERVNGRWQLTNPAYPAQGVLIQNWIESLARLHRRDHLEAPELLALPGGLAALGLDPPRATVTIEQGDQRIQLRLGARAPLGGNIYLQWVGSDGVEVTEALPLQGLPVSAASWRDATLIGQPNLRFNRIVMRAPAREFELQRDAMDRPWRLTRPRAARADPGRVEQLIHHVLAAEVSGFASEFVTADLEPFGLQVPAATLSFAEGTNVLLTVDFGRSPTNATDRVFARRSNLPGVVLVPRALLDRVAVPYADLLDDRMLDRPIETVVRVDGVANGPFTLERSPEGVWRITAPREAPADPALVAMFLGQLQSLRMVDVAKEVVTDLDLPSYGLAPPRRQYTLRWPAPTGSTGEVFQLDFGAHRAGQVFVRRADEHPVYTVRLEDAAALPVAGFEFRDRRLWSFTTNDVLGLRVTLPGRTNRLVRHLGGRWTVAADSQGMINTLAVEEAVHRFGSLRAGRWVAEGANVRTNFGFAAVAHQLSLELQRSGRTETLTLEFGERSPSGGPFAALVLDGEPVVFECPLEIYSPYAEVVRGLMPSPNPP